MPPNNLDSDRIHAMIEADLNPEDQNTIEDIFQNIQLLRQIKTQPVSEAKTSDLIGVLQSELKTITQIKNDKHRDRSGSHDLWTRLSWMLLVIRSQIKTLQREIWIASPFIILLGTLTTLVAFDPESQMLTPLAITAPIIAAVGVGLLYDDDTALIRELERATMTSLTMLLFARLMLIFSFNLIITLLCSVILSVVQPEISLIPLIMSWLAPMTFLSALAFFISVLSNNALAGGITSFTLWVLHLVMKMSAQEEVALQIVALQGLTAESTKPFLILFAIPMVMVALWFTTRQESLGLYTV